MKKYEKPILIVLSLSGNERLCGDCAERGNYLLVNDPSLAGMIDSFFLDGNGIGERSDFVGVFGSGEDNCSKKVDGYCKFTSGQLVAWS